MKDLLSLEEAIEVSDYYTRVAIKVIMEHLDSNYSVGRDVRKVVLDTVNDLKRNIIRAVYGAD